jgi:heat shock protein HslJ
MMRRPSWVELLGLPLLLLSGCAGNRGGDPPPESLEGTSWRLEDLAGGGVADGVEATLEFAPEGKVAGRASCNRFFGTVKVSGEKIAFTGLGATKMACPEPAMSQEKKYLVALENARRFTRDGPRLLIHAEGLEQPLRFVAQ